MIKYQVSGAGTTTNIYHVNWFLFIVTAIFLSLAIYSCVVDHYRYEETATVLKAIKTDLGTMAKKGK